jgi:rhamnogalacturonan endolyase
MAWFESIRQRVSSEQRGLLAEILFQISKYFLGLMLIAALGNPGSALAAFGLTTNANNYSVDTGAGLVFKIRRDNPSSTTSPGDIMSLVYKGVEYQDQTRGSQVNSGFDWIYNYTNLTSVSTEVTGTNLIKITVKCGDPASTNGLLTHYYIARRGYPHIYMATHFTREPDVQSLVRYILRIPSNLLPNGPVPSDIRNNTGAIESGDIFGMANGTTRSKHYSNMRVIDWSYIGATGNNVGLWMVRDNNEGASGGPFYRCLLNQCDSDQEITYIVNYGESQTEAYRIGIFNGLYTLVFTDGDPPGPIDTSWLQTTGWNLAGFVGDVFRGAVVGTVSGVPTQYQAVVGFSNTNAQYWAIADTNGHYSTPLMISGTYTAKLYRQELVVASSTVTVSAGATNTLNLDSTFTDSATIFRVGRWDGTPAGFLNADRMTTMHPSDVRMSSWTLNSNVFMAGTDSIATFPAICMRGVNAHNYIKFNLGAGQIGNLTLKIGATVAGFGGRPDVKINGVDRSFPSPSSQPSTRTWTVGSYRGNNVTWTWTLPSANLVVGENTIDISPVSGTTDSGPYLSAGWVYDCVELSGSGGPIAPSEPPSGLTASAGNAQVTLNWFAVSNATSYAVSRANVTGGPYAFIAVTGAATNFVDASVTNGVTYYYVLTALNANGETGHSLEVSATPAPPPALLASYVDGVLALSWPNPGWTLQMQTNDSATGLGTNWVSIPDSTSMTSTNIPMDLTGPGMFYRLKK